MYNRPVVSLEIIRGGTHGIKFKNVQTKTKHIKHSLIFIKLEMNNFGP